MFLSHRLSFKNTNSAATKKRQRNLHNIIHLNCSTTYQNCVDETKQAFGFFHARELHYRTIMKIGPAHSAFSKHDFGSAPQGRRGVDVDK